MCFYILILLSIKIIAIIYQKTKKMNLTLLNNIQLERSSIVANSQMNRERNLFGSNSYEKELNLNPITYLIGKLSSKSNVAWLDICCGSGKALTQAAEDLNKKNLENRIKIIGIDLVSFFYPMNKDLTCLELIVKSILDYNPSLKFDLITCVHGLHYLGDKLSIIAKITSWLTDDGLFLANIDPNSFCDENSSSIAKPITKMLKTQGVNYNNKKHLISCQGKKLVSFPYYYLGASDLAGANYTKQPAINSYYKKI
jgi:SAM-dependent methyltransferase